MGLSAERVAGRGLFPAPGLLAAPPCAVPERVSRGRVVLRPNTVLGQTTPVVQHRELFRLAITKPRERSKTGTFVFSLSSHTRNAKDRLGRVSERIAQGFAHDGLIRYVPAKAASCIHSRLTVCSDIFAKRDGGGGRYTLKTDSFMVRLSLHTSTNVPFLPPAFICHIYKNTPSKQSELVRPYAYLVGLLSRRSVPGGEVFTKLRLGRHNRLAFYRWSNGRIPSSTLTGGLDCIRWVFLRNVKLVVCCLRFHNV